MSVIKKIHAYEIIDSRGYPTIEATMTLDNGVEVISSAPSGVSLTKYEGEELRDNDQSRFDGMGVMTAVSYINELIGPKLINASPDKQQAIDNWLIKADGTERKSKLGVNTIMVISKLCAKAAAASLHIPLFQYLNSYYEFLFKEKIAIERMPVPIFSIINGGKYANNDLDFQEFQVIPSSSYSFGKSYQIGVEVFHELKRVLMYRNVSIAVGEEGGFTPNFSTNADALEVLNEALLQKGLKAGLNVFFGLDFAASHFYKDDRYLIKDKTQPLKRDEYIEFLLHLTENYSFLLLEDPLQPEDWEGWKKLSGSISDKIYVVGNDMLATNKQRIMKAIQEKACSTILIKLSQQGTITETLEAVNLARKNHLSYIVSHRSGETNDPFAADLAVGIQADFVKFGAPTRGERVSKYNRLWQIERDELPKNASVK